MLGWLKLFYQRRIAVPIDEHGIMLDVGCGDKPHWRADVLVDKFVSAGHAKQRNLGGEVEAVEPLFESPLEQLPFRENAFDFVYCSHVLEHVADPAAAFSEMLRVGKRGYIEVPFVGIQKIYDQETHLWLCDMRERTLSFTAKGSATYDTDIERFLLKGPLRPFATLMNFYPDAAMLRVNWSKDDPINVVVIGEPNLALSEPPPSERTAPPARNRWPLLRSVLRAVFFRKRRRAPIGFNSIVKEQYRLPVDEPLARKIYRLNGETPAP